MFEFELCGLVKNGKGADPGPVFVLYILVQDVWFGMHFLNSACSITKTITVKNKSSVPVIVY